MARVAIVGATGYTGLELLRLLSGHPHVEVTCVTSRKEAGKSLKELFPFWPRDNDLVLSPPDPQDIALKAELAFLCVPHGAAAKMAVELLKEGLKVVDLSADFRLRDKGVYEAWYKVLHPAPDWLEKAVYGLSEIYKEEIKKAQLIANPGCYPTASLLPLVPLLKKGLVRPKEIIIDAKSGASGAGRSPKLQLIYCEVNENFYAYNIAQHRHTPEIEQELSKAAGQDFLINFTTHLVPMSRGILATIYAWPKEGVSEDEIRTTLEEFYRSSPFVEVLPPGQFPQTAQVKGTNRVLLGLTLDSRTGRLILVSAIDNLVKGASGQAIQNMNLMLGFPEEAGLSSSHPLFP